MQWLRAARVKIYLTDRNIFPFVAPNGKILRQPWNCGKIFVVDNEVLQLVRSQWQFYRFAEITISCFRKVNALRDLFGARRKRHLDGNVVRQVCVGSTVVAGADVKGEMYCFLRGDIIFFLAAGEEKKAEREECE